MLVSAEAVDTTGLGVERIRMLDQHNLEVCELVRIIEREFSQVQARTGTLPYGRDPFDVKCITLTRSFSRDIHPIPPNAAGAPDVDTKPK